MDDFIAGYISGATGILIGSPLDIVKVRLQQHRLTLSSSSASSASAASANSITSSAAAFPNLRSLIRGTAAPILGYGALNGLLFSTYTTSLAYLPSSSTSQSHFTAGLIGGLATFLVSAPTETIKCRSQILQLPSITVARSLGIRGCFTGGTVTVLRDAIGYGFYFKSYEEMRNRLGWGVLLAGGIAGCISWASIYPLDVIKTRVQVQDNTVVDGERRGLLDAGRRTVRRLGAWECAKKAYLEEGASVFFRGLGICMARAFLVNAVQWAVYEYIMVQLRTQNTAPEEQQSGAYI